MTQAQRLQAVSASGPEGRAPGTRGQVTRQKLLDATVALVSETSWRSVKVTDIARRAGRAGRCRGGRGRDRGSSRPPRPRPLPRPRACH